MIKVERKLTDKAKKAIQSLECAKRKNSTEPHHGDSDLMYDWNNFFLSCAHCNNTKLGKYEPIIDCTKENVEKAIAFRKKGYFGTEEELVFEKMETKSLYSFENAVG